MILCAQEDHSSDLTSRTVLSITRECPCKRLKQCPGHHSGACEQGGSIHSFTHAFVLHVYSGCSLSASTAPCGRGPMKHRGSPGAHNRCSVLAVVISSIQINLGPSTVTKGDNVSRPGDGCEKVRTMGIREDWKAGRRESNLSSQFPTRSQFRNTWKRKCDEIS